MVPINRVNSFLKAAECRSFSAAARELGVTPAAISKHIQALEVGFGTRLFHRSSRALSLTEAGRSYHEHVREAFQLLRDAEESIRSVGQQPGGTVRVTLPIGLGRTHVMPLISKFREQHADVTLELRFDDRQIDLVQEAFDVGIGNTLSKDSQMVAYPLLPLQRVVLGAPSYLARAGIPKTLEDLERHNCLCVRSACTGRLIGWEFQRADDIVTIPVKGSLVVNEPLLACDAAAQGVGLTMVGTIQALKYLATGRLVALLTEHARPPQTVYIYYPHRRHLAPSVRAFVTFVTTHIHRLVVPTYGNVGWR